MWQHGAACRCSNTQGLHACRHACRRLSGADLDFMRELMAALEAEGIAAPAPIEQRWSVSSRCGHACATASASIGFLAVQKCSCMQ